MAEFGLRNIRNTLADFKHRKILRAPFHLKFRSKARATLVNSRTFISSKHKYIYFRIPKAANSFILGNMYLCETGKTPSLEETDAHKKTGSTIHLLNGLELDNAIRNYFKFTLVRDPYSRFVSAYLDKIVRKKAPSVHVYAALEKDKTKDISLSEFAWFLEQDGALYLDGHWTPQTDLVPIPNDQLDFIGQFENLGQDCQEILKRIYGAGVVKNLANSHATGADKKTENLLDNAMRDRIFRLYERDFDRFEYSR